MLRFAILALAGVLLAACEPPAAYYRTLAFGAITVTQVDSGDMAGAERTLALALATAGVLQDSSLRAWALTGFGAAQAKAGDAPGAARSAAAARAAAGSESTPYYRALGLIEVAEAQLAANDLAGARETAALAAEAAERIAIPAGAE